MRGISEPDRWRLQTFWADRQALERLRAQGTPAGVLMFRDAGTEPTLSVFSVMAELPAAGA